MSQKIGLYHDSIRYGEIDLDTVFIMVPADYTCEPKGVVTYEEVRQIAKVLRQGRDIETGVVGKFDWCKEYPPKSSRPSREATPVDRRAFPESPGRRCHPGS